MAADHDNMTDDVPEEPPRAVNGGGVGGLDRFAKPFFKALGLWLVVYVVTAHILVAWKWWTIPSGAQLVVAGDVEAVPDLEPLQRLKEQLDIALERVGRERATIRSALERVEGLGGGGSGEDDPMIKKSTPPVALPHLLRLLPLLVDQSWTTKYRSTGALREAFFRVRRELQDAKRLGTVAEATTADGTAAHTTTSHPDWAATNHFLRSLFAASDDNGNGNGDRESEATVDLDWAYLLPNCPVARSGYSADDGMLLTASSADDSTAASLDLDRRLSEDPRIREYVDVVRELLDGRLDPDKDWCVALWDTEEQLEEAVEEYVLGPARDTLLAALDSTRVSLQEKQAAYAEAVRAAEEADAASELQQCVLPSQVVEWIDAGLDAQYRRRSIRQAILDAMARDSRISNASAIVLDADPEDDELFERARELGPRRRRTPRTLRSLFETPLAHEAAHFLDAAVERLEGRNDLLDRWIDAWYTSAAAADDSKDACGGGAAALTLGKWAVIRLGNAAGKLDDLLSGWTAIAKRNSEGEESGQGRQSPLHQEEIVEQQTD